MKTRLSWLFAVLLAVVMAFGFSSNPAMASESFYVRVDANGKIKKSNAWDARVSRSARGNYIVVFETKNISECASVATVVSPELGAYGNVPSTLLFIGDMQSPNTLEVTTSDINNGLRKDEGFDLVVVCE